jgi:hypothetical protein
MPWFLESNRLLWQIHSTCKHEKKCVALHMFYLIWEGDHCPIMPGNFRNNVSTTVTNYLEPRGTLFVKSVFSYIGSNFHGQNKYISSPHKCHDVVNKCKKDTNMFKFTNNGGEEKNPLLDIILCPIYLWEKYTWTKAWICFRKLKVELFKNSRSTAPRVGFVLHLYFFRRFIYQEIYMYLLLLPFQNIRCFSLSLTHMYLDIF